MEKKDSVMLTVDEVASYLRLHPLTVRCLARQGNIPADIEPARFQFINSPLTLALCQRYDDLREWATSIAQSVETGAVQSLSFPITSRDSCNAIGQVYHGPVVLVTDALCYSATDIFAAGFQIITLVRYLALQVTRGQGALMYGLTLICVSWYGG